MKLHKHRIRVSIRTQLIALVLFVAMFSLLILAIVTGCYFTTVLTDTRVSKLEVVAELKSSQLQQYMDTYYYQVFQLSEKRNVQKALTMRKAGNTSKSALEDAQTTMEQTLEASTALAYARLYDLNFVVVANVSNPDNKQNASSTVLQELYILEKNTTESGPSLPDGMLDNRGYLDGPIKDDSSYLMSLTLPVYANESILLPQQFLSGYLTVVLDLSFDNSSLYSTLSSTSGNSEKYIINYFAPAHPYNNLTNYTGFYYAFETEYKPDEETYDIGNTFLPKSAVYNISSFAPAEDVFALGKDIGNYLNIKDPKAEKVSLGFSSVDLALSLWMVTVEQHESEFDGPVTKLIKIMVGVCIGLAGFLAIITFPLAHYGVRPILKLQKATEEITERRGLKRKKKRKHNNPFFGLQTLMRFENGDDTNAPGGNGSKELNNDSKDNINEKMENIEKNLRSDYNNSTSPISAFTPTNFRHSWNGSLHTPSSMESFTNSDFDSSINGNVTSTPLPSLVQTRGLFVDELTELTEAFNAMTLELDRQYSHLEERVRARTKELEAAKVQADTARQQAEKANEAKTVFIANISHELRTPLNGILGMTSVAMSETDINKIQQSLELIFRSGELLLHILIQLLTFSKNQLDKSKLQKKNFLMVEVASQIKSIFGKTAKDHDVNLLIIMKPKLIRKLILYGDSNRIIQVVMNLVSNSLKFTPENGTVRALMQILGEYDEERSEKSNFEKVYIKDLPNDAEQYPVTPVSKVLSEIFKNADSDVSSMLSKNTTSSLSTLSSSVYIKSLAALYNSPDSEIKYFNDDEFTKEDNNEGLEIHHKTRKCYKFGQNKKWVLRFSVSDTGTGIEKSLQDKIFEAFVQGDQTLSRSHGGTGLGLSICKQFAKMMHGTLTLNSNVGEGSTFTFTIPLPQVGEIIPDEKLDEKVEDEFNENYNKLKRVTFLEDSKDEDVSFDYEDEINESPLNLANSYKSSPLKGNGSTHKNDQENNIFYDKPELITRASTGTAHSYRSKKSDSSLSDNLTTVPSNDYDCGLKLLVAEDNSVNQEVVKRMLKLEHIGNVTMARDGKDAVEFVTESLKNNKPFDLILMDVQMPNMDGLSATKVIRKELGFTGPIVALTAFADVSNEKGCIEAGMSGFLSKPIRRSLLRSIIRQFCSELNTPLELDETDEASESS